MASGDPAAAGGRGVRGAVPLRHPRARGDRATGGRHVPVHTPLLVPHPRASAGRPGGARLPAGLLLRHDRRRLPAPEPAHPGGRTPTPASITPSGSTVRGGRTRGASSTCTTLVNAGGRATIRATMHGEDGSLHLSMAQELLIRELDEPLVFEAPPWVDREPHRKERRWVCLTVGRRVVTGGGSGIGRATCRRMAEEGARVAVLDVDGESAAAVAGEIGGIGVRRRRRRSRRAAGPPSTRPRPQLGGLSIIYNNAGTSAFDRLHELDPAEWERVLRVNLTGVWAGIRAAAPAPAGGRRRLHREHRVDQRDATCCGRRAVCRQQGGRGGADGVGCPGVRTRPSGSTPCRRA